MAEVEHGFLDKPNTQTCQLVWLRPSQDPLVGKARAQRGLNASQVGIVILWQSVTLRSRSPEIA